MHNLILRCKRRKQRFAKKCQLSAKSSTQLKTIKNVDKQFFNMSVDLPNELSNGIKLLLKYDQ